MAKLKIQKKPELKRNSLLSVLTNNFKFKFRIRVEISLCGASRPVCFAKTLGIKKATEFVEYLFQSKFTNLETYLDHLQYSIHLDESSSDSKEQR